jgi:hypothetical protein
MRQYFIAPVAALAMMLSLEGSSAAKTRADLISAATSGASDASTTTSAVAADAALEVTPASSQSNEKSDVTNPLFAARIRVCHISRHPRDGMPSEEHACPLLVAQATDAVTIDRRSN